MSDVEMPKLYVPASAEDRWYAWWEQQGFFTASNAPEDTRETYTVAIPPPNVTGTLHMGHACRTTFEDVLVRYERMKGKNALWVPGTDHAGIATQVVVERKLKAEGLTRHDLGREKFIERVWEWRKESGDTILGQLRKMGASCDWSRTKFTMDPDLSHAVREAFVRLYEEGLIYRGTRLVNWDVVSQTVLSDLEVETEENVKYTEEFGVCELFDFAYKLDAEDAAATGVDEIIVSTTRPETMLGDTALAVHPEDERYKGLHGRFVTHPFVDRRIPIVCDATLVDPEFGTGVVKVTPAHDPNDFATGKRHGLEEISILNKDGTLNENGGPFAGLERFEARKAVKAKLEELGLARGKRKHVMSLPRSQRSGSIVEPMISTQWFVKMEPLAGPAIEAVESGKVQILPEDWTKTYFHWLRNIQDWCISRQLWWGHGIPAWYCGDCEHMSVSRTDLSACEKCGSANVEQDPDVLDTWFSSALWPFSTLGWPNQTPDLARFYPTQDMETGYDILFFWVARMIMMGLHFMGEVPFSRVLLAGLVTDERGQKMSKVKGNVIDPLDVIHGATGAHLLMKAEQAGAAADGVEYLRTTYPDGFDAYGADALRMTLLSYSPQSRRIALSIKRIEGYRNFANKLWNAARYVLGRLVGQDGEPGPHPDARATGARPAVTALPNRWILSRLDVALASANAGITAYRLDEGSQALYHFVWDELCDWYLELSKPLLDGDDRALAEETAAVLLHVLETTLRALHPMMPFITEEIWQRVPRAGVAAGETIMLARYPQAGTDSLRDEASERELAVVQEFVVAARSIRAEYDLPRKQGIAIHWCADDAEKVATIETARSLIEALAGATLTQEEAAKVDDPHQHFTLAAAFVLPGLRGVVPGVIDPVKERERLTRQLTKVEKELGTLEKKLTNEKFLGGAPAEVVEQTKRDAAELREKRDQMSGAIARLG
ncbi:MAG: valine--tRNA ligase [Myxococcales bacterium]|nr:valine--tRNA ligase [Myxococcales bacterium]MCB9627985.1 valine--tRNA ligase [Sandaracinaceae bacterium]